MSTNIKEKGIDMLFFINKKDYNRTGVHSGTFRNIEKNALENIETVTEYYKNTIAKIENDNPLVKAINQLYNNNSDLVSYILEIKSRIEYDLRNLGFVTDNTKGKVFNDISVENCKEVFIVSGSSISDILNIKLEEEWKNLKPLKCELHPFKGIEFINPNNKVIIEDNKENIIVYSIDIIMLMIQFRFYYLNAKRLDRGVNIPEFVRRYVYTNSTESFVNFSILNSYMDYNLDNLEFSKFKLKSKFPRTLLNIDNIYNNYMLEFSNKLGRLSKREEYSMLLSNLNLLDKNGLDFLTELDSKRDIVTNLNRWVFILIKLKVIYFCIEYFGENGMRNNRVFITSLRLSIKMYSRENTYVPKEVSEYFFKYLNKINSLIGIR